MSSEITAFKCSCGKLSESSKVINACEEKHTKKRAQEYEINTLLSIIEKYRGYIEKNLKNISVENLKTCLCDAAKILGISLKIDSIKAISSYGTKDQIYSDFASVIASGRASQVKYKLSGSWDSIPNGNEFAGFAKKLTKALDYDHPFFEVTGINESNKQRFSFKYFILSMYGVGFSTKSSGDYAEINEDTSSRTFSSELFLYTSDINSILEATGRLKNIHNKREEYRKESSRLKKLFEETKTPAYLISNIEYQSHLSELERLEEGYLAALKAYNEASNKRANKKDFLLSLRNRIIKDDLSQFCVPEKSFDWDKELEKQAIEIITIHQSDQITKKDEGLRL
jgi:hypothetical protein